MSTLAQSFGVTLQKVPGRHELEISAAAGAVTFPIVTDERAWAQTSVDEAFYVVLLDACEWSRAHVDDTSIASMDDIERSELPAIRRDLSEELARLARLTELLGGRERLASLWQTAELPAA